MDGFISQIHRLSATDDSGMRTTVMAVGCPMKCLWCNTPELIGDAAKFLYKPVRCIGCGSCVTQQSGGETVCQYEAYASFGEIVSVNELVQRLLTDKSQYEKTGGGVTFSGGDAALQADFFYAVTQLLKEAEISVALETSGYFPWEKLERLVKAVDLVIYDLKFLSRHLHRRYTGVDNQLILENAVRIAGLDNEMIVSLLLIPGINDSNDEITGRLKFIKSLGSNVKVNIVKYRKLDTDKFASLEMIEMMEGTLDCPDSLADYAANTALSMGIEVVGNMRPSVPLCE